jgi:hypothetical protein
VAACTVNEPDPDVPETTWRFPVAGRLSDLAALAERHVEDRFAGSHIMSLVAVNASEAAKHVRTEALEIGLPEANDFSPVWENWRFPEWMDRDELRAFYGDDVEGRL